MLRDSVIVYDDGTPRTKHITTNLLSRALATVGSLLAPAAAPDR
jgi:hypothetical protein